MRYFLTLSYLGTHYSGWQVQPNAPSVQTTLESALTTILRQPVGVTGCGRTDAGVHARYYVAHFDAVGELPPTFLSGLNSLLPPDIAVHNIREVHPQAHARFDAFERSYEYHFALRKDPFSTDTAWFFLQNGKLDLNKMKEVADLLPKYASFFPFCKSDSGTEGYDCEMKAAHWDYQPDAFRLLFHITANRFLRGMVRLIVGACVNAGLGKIEIQDVKSALDEQTPLKKSLSVPPQGLLLTDVKYPYSLNH
ncbi:MAG TPA: tRNA pseudouridine(38-40) synthase TruA [Saprospiraceae bacterium]|nr:tRNA pseudouridine(38-40) synthase TruA [Saprospiraceae bacterium]